MSFDEKIAALVQRIPKLIDDVKTEEATKNALVMPFISALGYDVFNPKEVVPEFTADVGTKKGEKVDYAIMRNSETIMLVECKKAGSDLSQENMSQLFRYFTVTQARISILTNGINYWFFSDLDEPNKMDSRPFLELDLYDPKPNELYEIKKLAKEEFDLDMMLSVASELKCISETKKVFAAQLENPDEEFVRFFFSRSNPSARFTAAARTQFIPIITKSFHQFINEKVNDRLRSALEKDKNDGNEPVKVRDEAEVVEIEGSKAGIVTTQEELDGFNIVRAIMSKVVPASRVVYRDTKTYFGILLDDNNRKPICRLMLRGKQKYLIVFDCEKKEERISIESIENLYNHTERIIQSGSIHLKEGSME